MNRRAKVYLKAAEIVEEKWATRSHYFYTAIREAGGTSEDDGFAIDMMESGLPLHPDISVSRVDDRVTALCFLAAMVDE